MLAKVPTVLLPVLLAAALLQPAPAEAAQRNDVSFSFSVMADLFGATRAPDDNVRPPEQFLQAVREINLIRPDLVLIAGDLIQGYTEDEALIQEEWDAFTEALRYLEVPAKLAPGNHDVWSPRSREIWIERWGPLHHSFMKRGCRFIALNVAYLEGGERIEGEQLEWLKGELRRPGARRIFVFLHKPFWRYPGGTTNWMDEIHPLLVEAGVEAVFAGHWHHYEKSTTRDGIRYYIAGGLGGDQGQNPHAGDFHHHLLVQVPGRASEPVRVHVLRTGFLEPDTVVSEEAREQALALTRSLMPEAIGVREGESADVSIRIEATSQHDAPLVVRHQLEASDSGGWTMEPGGSEFLLPPGERKVSWLRFRADGEDLLPGPTLSLTGKIGDETVVRTTERVPIRFDRTLRIRRAAGPIRIDGSLEEVWEECDSGGRFLQIGGRGYAELPTDFRACRDDEALYLGFRAEQPGSDRLQGRITARDWRVPSEDCIFLYIDPVRDGRTRFCLGATAMGVAMDYRAPGGAVDLAWNPEWEWATARDVDGWTFEARVPFSILDLEPGEGVEIGLNVIRRSTYRDGEFTGWSIPWGGRLSDPKGFGTGVLD